MYLATAYTLEMVPFSTYEGTLPSVVLWLADLFPQHHQYGTLNNSLASTGVYAKALKDKAGRPLIVVVKLSKSDA